ncbi:hypothetical protein LTR37_016014 [Vermiconidia calcicola]|uniref:Uncharacterized protein n=1 Tax=Vermiconidia calcicola TaxID=1690605 RepID=A0ACC3MP73_9PEZI|nr:hypothetical protein LTR37_016014 [Vermiconidia calcicola]
MASTMRLLGLSALTLSSLVYSQQVGKKPEVHPKLTTQTCSKKDGCTTHETSVVLDALAHPIKNIHTGKSCLTSDGSLKKKICSTAESCAANCALEGVDYADHGVYTQGDRMAMRMYLREDGKLESVSPRVYLLDENKEEYSMLKLLGQEVSFDTDVSNLPCATGGRSELNPAGATYGTGYCDAQCFNTSAFINGVANVDTLGACCNEMDLWGANAVATQYAPHTCNKPGLYPCKGAECGEDGVCDKPGCGFNPYQLGRPNYYGYDNKVDTTKPFTVVTQFHTDDGTTVGTLDEIRRMYVQDGEVIHNAVVKFHKSTIDSLTPAFCKSQASEFQKRGGLPTMGEPLGRGMVMAFSVWADEGGFMNWLDAGDAGPCGPKEGNPDRIKKENPGTSVVFSNIKWGDIGSTY